MELARSSDSTQYSPQALEAHMQMHNSLCTMYRASTERRRLSLVRAEAGNSWHKAKGNITNRSPEVSLPLTQSCCLQMKNECSHQGVEVMPPPSRLPLWYLRHLCLCASQLRPIQSGFFIAHDRIWGALAGTGKQGNAVRRVQRT